MPKFHYVIQQADGEKSEGVVEASSQIEAMKMIRRLSGIVLSVKEQHDGVSLKMFSRKKVSLKERLLFSEQIAVMIKAGIPLAQAIRGLTEENPNPYFVEVLKQIGKDVEGGTPFSTALTKFPHIFSRIFYQMVAAGEQSGNLAEVLQKLTIQQQKEYELKGKVRGALIYPAIITVLLFGVIIMVVTFILPKLTGLFTDSGVELPFTTKLLLSLSDFINQNYWFLIIGFIGGIFALKRAMKTAKGQWIRDTVILKIPVLGAFFIKSYMARFCQSFASLAQAGIPVLDIFKITQGVIGNVVYEAELRQIAREVENGQRISLALRKSRLFPAMIPQLVAVGEQSGDMVAIFTVLGDFFEKEVDGMAKNLSTALEPIIMIFMGAGVAFVLISVLQPILSLTSAV